MATAQTASKGRRAVKAPDLLKKQHREVKAMFRQVQKTENPRERRKYLDKIGQALKIHTSIEEEIFYPAVGQIGTEKAEGMVAEAYEEHHVVDLVLAELPKVDPNDERFEAKMKVFSELVEHHADEEEAQMFPMAERKLGTQRLAELGQQMASRVEKLEKA